MEKLKTVIQKNEVIVSGETLGEELEFFNGSYSVSNIQKRFEDEQKHIIF